MATRACRPTGTASTAPPRCSAPVRSTAPTPTSTWAGSITAAATRSIAELTQDILKLNVVGFFVFAMPTQPLGWFKKELNGSGRLQGPEVPHRRSRLQRHAGDGRQRRAACLARKFCRRWKRASSTRSSSTTRPRTAASAPRTLPSSTTWAPTTRRRKRSKSSTTRRNGTAWPRSSSRSSSWPVRRPRPTTAGRRGTSTRRIWRR